MALPFDPKDVEYVEALHPSKRTIQINFKDGSFKIIEGNEYTDEVAAFIASLKDGRPI